MGIAKAQTPVPRTKHVAIFIEENHSYNQMLGMKDLPHDKSFGPKPGYFMTLEVIGASVADAHGLFHPSQPDHVALFSSSNFGVTDDSCSGSRNPPDDNCPPYLGAESPAG